MLDFIAPDSDISEDNWRAITFLMHAQYQEEFDKTTISSQTVSTASAQSTDIGLAMSDDSNNEEKNSSKRKRDWSMSATSFEFHSQEDDLDDEYDGLLMINR